MAKNIVFCADGTWNSPCEDDNHDGTADPTNVYKLFLRLEGTLDPDSLRDKDEQEMELRDGRKTVQVAKYIHGVGDSDNRLNKLLGGAFGAGLVSRIVRGYTFVSRNYDEGDNIVLVGFSRGAYTARALAGLIVSQGLLSRGPLDKRIAYMHGMMAWYRYRAQSSIASDHHEQLEAFATGLPDFGIRARLATHDLVPVERIAAVAVWDTVGAMGLPVYARDGHRKDLFQFANRALSPKVESGFQALALDEQRADFTPTLWEKREGVVQRVFPGSHADVGGGYPLANNESGLSDCALAWMLDKLGKKGVGLQFTDKRRAYDLRPDPKGTAHRPWAEPPWSLLKEPLHRKFLLADRIDEDPSVEARRKAGSVKPAPDAKPEPYDPPNRPC